MVIDSSAIVAVMLRQPGWEHLVQVIEGAEFVAVGAPTLCETAMVLTSRLGGDPRAKLERFLGEAEVEVIPFTAEHYEVAVSAFLRFGKGRHPAALNFGDCLSYATARVAGMPLLYAGEDFARTDLQSAG
jgi:ribonuclease VapC